MLIRSLIYEFGDNKSAVDSSMTLNRKIHKRHIAMSFHRVRESMATGIVTYHSIDEKNNPADMLSKHWSHNDIWFTLKPILFWPIDTIECFDNDVLEQCGSSF